MIKDFLAAQKDLLAQAEERLEIYRDKLDKVNTIKDDLKSHIQSLPDLTQLPDVTGGLAPLPSAGDLFTVLRWVVIIWPQTKYIFLISNVIMLIETKSVFEVIQTTFI